MITRFPVHALIERRHALTELFDLRPYEPQAQQAKLEAERQCNCNSRYCPACVFKLRNRQLAALLRVCERAQHETSSIFTVMTNSEPSVLRTATRNLLNRTRQLMAALNSSGCFYALNHGTKHGLHLHGIVLGRPISESFAANHLGSDFRLAHSEPTENIFSWAKYIAKASESDILEDFANSTRWREVSDAWHGLRRYNSSGALRCTGREHRRKPLTKARRTKLEPRAA